MKRDTSMDAVKEIMLTFAKSTGLLESGSAPKRYLWTDAFAVCNYLELYRQTKDGSWRELAVRLVEQVHHVLGRHRADSAKKGWISGLSEAEGERHPTCAGLRIGKRLQERRPDEFPDERLEWDRDGQYYHYLAKWMHALSCVGRVTGDPRYLQWAFELAKAAHAGFTHTSTAEEGKFLYWKMSIDLSRPQATAMGQHDPLDGLVACWELQAAAKRFPGVDFPDLGTEVTELTEMCRGRDWGTDDTLGIGGMLCAAAWLSQVMVEGEAASAGLLREVLDASTFGLETVLTGGQLELSGRFRLAFRELGLAIGLKAVEPLAALVEKNPAGFGDNVPALRERLHSLQRYLPLGEKIVSFWMDPVNQETGTWHEHGEINMVMLATSLAPEEFLRV
ncbi:MAG TPA: hypothetical protein VJ550_07070 [Geomonas sp.]|nr:hypothetical protein [Geomonas sp.]